MAKVYMMCAPVCCGKTTAAAKLRKEKKAVVLSVDDITLALFGQNAGEKHDFYVAKLEEYFYQKSLEIIAAGHNVVLDWGFWTKKERDFARKFYESHNVSYEFRYLKISSEEWKRRIEKRNKAIQDGRENAYFIDDGLFEKFRSIFQEPQKDESNVIFIEQRQA